jgi:hypothetical protein
LGRRMAPARCTWNVRAGGEPGLADRTCGRVA